MSQLYFGFGRTLILAAALLLTTADYGMARGGGGGGHGGGGGGHGGGGGYRGGYGGGYGGYGRGGYYGGYGGYGYGGYGLGYGGYGYGGYGGYGSGYGSYGYGYDPYYGMGYSPYSAPPSTSMYFDPFSSSSPGSTSAAKPDMTTHVRVTLPDPSAEVTVNGMKTATTGTVREFQSPPLEPGNYAYEIQATWKENGRTKTKTEKVSITPGGWKAITIR